MANVKPREIKEAQGTLRKHREEGLGFDAPLLDKSKTITTFNERERKWFDSIYNNLEPTRVMKETDLYTLELMAKARATIEECDEILEKEGKVYYLLTREGEIQKINPWVNIRRYAESTFLELCYQFGLSPVSRGKMPNSKSNQDDESDLSKLLRERNEE